MAVRPWVDPPARQHLEQTYFGLRPLATTREEWTTAQIVEARAFFDNFRWIAAGMAACAPIVLLVKKVVSRRRPGPQQAEM